jgi:hypothetical protein
LDFVQSLLPKEEEVDWYQKPFKELIGMRFRDVTYTDNIITIGHNHTIETDKDGDVYLSFGGDAVGCIKQHGVLAEIVEPETKTENFLSDAVPYLKAGFDKFEKFKTESDEVKDDSDKSKIIVR